MQFKILGAIVSQLSLSVPIIDSVYLLNFKHLSGRIRKVDSLLKQLNFTSRMLIVNFKAIQLKLRQ